MGYMGTYGFMGIYDELTFLYKDKKNQKTD